MFPCGGRRPASPPRSTCRLSVRTLALSRARCLWLPTLRVGRPGSLMVERSVCILLLAPMCGLLNKQLRKLERWSLTTKQAFREPEGGYERVLGANSKVLSVKYGSVVLSSGSLSPLLWLYQRAPFLVFSPHPLMIFLLTPSPTRLHPAVTSSINSSRLRPRRCHLLAPGTSI